MKKFFQLMVMATGLFACGTAVQGQTFSMQIIGDNDFAVFGGTAGGVTSLLYQNNSTWETQLSDLSTLNFSLNPGETTFYILGMGGGGAEENISGTINGVDITTIPVSMSSDLGSFLTDYESENAGGTVEDGTYNASLPDVQAAFSSLTWGSPTYDNTQTVITQSPTGQGYSFNTGTAHLFAIDSSSVNVTPLPEPSTLVLAGMGGAVVLLLALRRRASL